MSLQALRIIDEEFQKELDGLTARLATPADAGNLLRRLQVSLRKRVMEEAVELPDVPAQFTAAAILVAHAAIENALAGNLSTLDPDPQDREFGDPNQTMRDPDIERTLSPLDPDRGSGGERPMQDDDYSLQADGTDLVRICRE